MPIAVGAQVPVFLVHKLQALMHALLLVERVFPCSARFASTSCLSRFFFYSVNFNPSSSLSFRFLMTLSIFSQSILVTHDDKVPHKATQGKNPGTGLPINVTNLSRERLWWMQLREKSEWEVTRQTLLDSTQNGKNLNKPSKRKNTHTQ